MLISFQVDHSSIYQFFVSEDKEEWESDAAEEQKSADDLDEKDRNDEADLEAEVERADLEHVALPVCAPHSCICHPALFLFD